MSRESAKKRTVCSVTYTSLTRVEPWHELLNALFQSTKSPEAAHRESAFRVFASLPNLVDPDHIDVLKNVFLAGLQDHAGVVLAGEFFFNLAGSTFCIQGCM
jgi:hypothetical protein